MPFDASESGNSTSMPSSQVASRPPPSLRKCKQRWFSLNLPRGLVPRLRARAAFNGEVVILLAEARALIEDESNWVKGCYATADRRYCAVGAVTAAARGRFGWHVSRRAQRLLRQQAGFAGYPSMESMNDSSTHRRILAVFDAAISMAPGQLC